MQLSRRNQEYLAGHVTEAEIVNNYMYNNLLKPCRMENVIKGSDNVHNFCQKLQFCFLLPYLLKFYISFIAIPTIFSHISQRFSEF